MIARPRASAARKQAYKVLAALDDKRVSLRPLREKATTPPPKPAPVVPVMPPPPAPEVPLDPAPDPALKLPMPIALI
jgi:hypothetical protein